ncbi:hypothetical protein [Paraburkholderia eburnea]|uniref:hypothetical protein n=1 Tax=Paraburkholderia eburnea TaxID=1189126 RepID=UPI000CDB9F6A|nr:hypothetical protein [Paraburkholderia eburnea]
MPLPGTALRTLLRDYNRLQSLAMLAASHADTRVDDLQQLGRLIREVMRAGPGDAGRATLALVENLIGQIESRARDDATMLLCALHRENLQEWPFPVRDPLAPPAHH